VIECRDGGHDTDRLDNCESPPIGARRRQPHRDFPAAHDAQLVGRVAHAVDGAIGFDQRIGQRLTALTRDLAAEMRVPALHQPGQLPENGESLMGLQPSTTMREEPCGSLNLVFERRRVIALELDDWRSIEYLDDLDHVYSPSFAVLARSSSTNTRMFSE
jgi:hypothetical protein